MKFSRLFSLYFIAGLLSVSAAALSSSPGFAQDLKPGAVISLEDAPLSVERVVEIALEHNRSLRSAGIRLESAEIKIREARGSLGLNVTATADYQRLSESTSMTLPSYSPAGLVQDVLVVDPVTYLPTGATTTAMVASGIPTLNTIALSNTKGHSGVITAYAPLFTFGLRKNAVEAARSGMKVKECELEAMRIEVALSAKEAYYNVLLAERAVAAQDEALTNAEAHLDAAQKNLEAGAAPKLDVIRAKSGVESARENLLATRKGYDLALMALNNLMGFPVVRKTKLSSEKAFVKIDLQPADYYVEMALRKRPEFGQIASGRAAAEYAAKAARLRPMVTFGGQYQYEASGGAFSAQENSWGMALTGTMPLFDHGLATSKVKQMLKTAAELRVSETDLAEGIGLLVNKAYLEVVEAGQRVETSQAILDMALEGFRMADLGFREGVTAQIDLLDAEHGLTQARLGRAKADFDYETAKARLARECGVVSVEEMK